MTILALEFSSQQRSVALASGGSILSEATESGGGRGVATFAMVERVLAAAKMEREEIESIAVGLGPGSYTGIRAAIALAEGWKLARDVRVTGVSSVEAIVSVARTEKIFGRACVIIDAQQHELYCARYLISEAASNLVLPLAILPRAEVKLLGHDHLLIGPDAPKFFPEARAVFPAAWAVATIAAARKDLPPAESLEPIYLRETTFVKLKPQRETFRHG